MAGRLLQVSKMVERRLWGFDNPLRQFDQLSPEIMNKLDERRMTVDKLKEMEATEIGEKLFKTFNIS